VGVQAHEQAHEKVPRQPDGLELELGLANMVYELERRIDMQQTQGSLGGSRHRNTGEHRGQD